MCAACGFTGECPRGTYQPLSHRAAGGLTLGAQRYPSQLSTSSRPALARLQLLPHEYT